jgi:predicted porin
LPAGFDSDSILQATLADVAAILVAARYKWDNAEIYGGYTYARLANPSDAFPNGFATIASGISVPPGEANATFYDVNQIMQTVWIGAKYNVRANLSVAASFTYQRQNDFLQAPATCTGFGAGTSNPKCGGGQSAIAFLVDYNPLPRIDLYSGMMVSSVYGGLASGYFKTQNFDPTIGLRTRF